MKEIVLKLGPRLSVIISTIISIALSLFVTAILHRTTGIDPTLVLRSYSIAFIIPLLVAPTVTYVLTKLLFQTFELENKLRALASTDYLTQLLNRREWMKQAESHINLASRNNSHFAVLMIDLDDFKTVNDSYGHLFGDKTLTLFGETINQLCRTSDIAARFGGEEFIILLPETTEEQALLFTKRLHSSIRSLSLKHRNETIQITISIGVCINHPNQKLNLELLISRADKALYQAKYQGKNCTLTSQD